MERNKKVTQKEVFDAAKAIAIKGKDPTLADVRFYLGDRGSQTTLHKYLKQWKQNCLRLATYKEHAVGQPHALIEEKRVLEQVLHQQRLQNEQYTQELMAAEKALLQLKSENQALQKALVKLHGELKDLAGLKNQFEALCQEMRAERDTLFEKVMAEKNRLIEALQEELKMINQQALTTVKEVAYERDDALIQEKVKIINLQERLIQLTEDNKGLSRELNKTKILNNQTRRQLDYYQKMVQDCVPRVAQEHYTQKSPAPEVNEKIDVL